MVRQIHIQKGDEFMCGMDFFDYIEENFVLSDRESRLIYNIVYYVASQGFVNKDEEHDVLERLLDGLGLTRSEIDMTNF